jgi:anti-sigma regulatory factor (Ser/Thr protein kinase)
MRQSLFCMEERSQIAEARRKIVDLAHYHGFNETQKGEVAIVMTEIAQNLIKHARSGQVLVRSLEDDGRQGLEILSLDNGPGIANVTRYIQDGCSTAGSCGNGLGAICRLSGLYDLHSVAGRGTALVVRFWVEEALQHNRSCLYAKRVSRSQR